MIEKLYCALIELKSNLENNDNYKEEQNKILMQLINKKDRICDEYIIKHDILIKEVQSLQKDIKNLSSDNKRLKATVEKYKPMYSLVYLMIIILVGVLGFACYV